MEASMNVTFGKLEYNIHRMSDYEILTWGFVFLPMIVISDVSNLIVIWIILSHKSMRKVTNYFIVNLSLADILITTFNVPINYFYMTHGNFPFGEIYCVFWNVIAVASMTSSVFTLTAIAFDRYRAILYPLEPRFSRVTSLTAIAIIWVLAILTSFPYIIYSNTTVDHFLNGDKAAYCSAQWPDGRGGESTIELLYNTVILIFVYAIPMLAIATLYYRVGNELERSHPVGERVDTRLAHRYTERKKIIRMLRTVVVFFAICWLPYHVYFLVIPFFPQMSEYTISSHLFLVIYLLAMSNSMFNPIIYVWMNNSFRRGFRNFLLCRCSRGIYSSDPSELDRTVVTSVSHSNKKIGYIKNKLHHKHAGQCNRTRANGRSSCTCHLVAESTGTSSPSKGFNVASGSSYVTNTPNGSQGGNLNSSASSPSPAAVTFTLNDSSGQAKVSVTNDTSKREENNSSNLPSNLLMGDLSPPSSFCSGSSLINSTNHLDHLLMVTFDKVPNKCHSKQSYLPHHSTRSVSNVPVAAQTEQVILSGSIVDSLSHDDKCTCNNDDTTAQGEQDKKCTDRSICHSLKGDINLPRQCVMPFKVDATNNSSKHDPVTHTDSINLLQAANSTRDSDKQKKKKKDRMKNLRHSSLRKDESNGSTICENKYREETFDNNVDTEQLNNYTDRCGQQMVQLRVDEVSLNEITCTVDAVDVCVSRPIVISNSCTLASDEATCTVTSGTCDKINSSVVSSVSTIVTSVKDDTDKKLSTATATATPSVSAVISSHHHFQPVHVNQCTSVNLSHCNDYNSTPEATCSTSSQVLKKTEKKQVHQVKKNTTVSRLSSLFRNNFTRLRTSDRSSESMLHSNKSVTDTSTVTGDSKVTTGSQQNATSSVLVSDCAISSV